MYHCITKDEYFAALDIPDIEGALAASSGMGLKHTQDACILRHIHALSAGCVAEIGGGHSRTLPFLANKGWECWNIDALEGRGAGPTQPYTHPGIRVLPTYVGLFDPRLPDEAFDVTYSVSVVEHIETEQLLPFFKDASRVTKNGGLSLHAVDVYLEDVPVAATRQRMADVLAAALVAGFVLMHSESIDDPVFHCRYATNPDLTIRQWNRIVPSLQDYRSRCQSCSYLLGLIKNTSQSIRG